MSRGNDPYGGGSGHTPRVDAVRLWAGGVAAAFVAAGIVVVGLLVARVLNVHVLINTGGGALLDVNTAWYAIGAAAATLVATALMYLLLLSAPRPELLFTAIMGIVTALAVLLPFTASATLESQVTVAAINLAVGITVIALLSGFGQSVIERPPPAPGAGQQPPPRPYADPNRDPYRDPHRDPYRDTYRDPYGR
jgi:uncharacterized protein DUF6069